MSEKDKEDIKYKFNITTKEKKLLNYIFNNYDIKVFQVERNRAVYKLKTNIGYLCLKRIKRNKNKAINGNMLSTDLKQNGFPNIVDYIKTKDNKIVIKYKKWYFYILKWINGREANMKDIKEAQKCIKLLAKFHKETMKLDKSKYKLKNNLGKWPENFNKRLLRLDYFKSIIENKKLRTKFDKEYYKNIELFYNIGLLSLNILNSSNYYEICKKYSNNKVICHNSFYYQNVIKEKGEYYLIDLDSIDLDIPCFDLGKFIRRLMHKSEYSWDFNKAKILIEAYCSVYPLNKEELKIMLSLIIFPHKFIRLGEKKYLKNKRWSEYKYSRKLEKVIDSEECLEKFIDDYLVYINDLS